MLMINKFHSDHEEVIRYKSISIDKLSCYQ